MCLAEFAANYTTRSGQEVPEDGTSDVLPRAEDGESRRSEDIKLKNDFGHMYKGEKILFDFTSLTKRKSQVRCIDPR